MKFFYDKLIANYNMHNVYDELQRGLYACYFIVVNDQKIVYSFLTNYHHCFLSYLACTNFPKPRDFNISAVSIVHLLRLLSKNDFSGT